MAELIEKQKVVDTMMDMAISGECCIGLDPRSRHMGKMAILKAIDKVKSIPAEERETAEWVISVGSMKKVCSNCGIFNNSRYKKFCPNCGRGMK